MYCEIVNQFKILTIQECPKMYFDCDLDCKYKLRNEKQKNILGC